MESEEQVAVVWGSWHDAPPLPDDIDDVDPEVIELFENGGK
ncbi:MAG: hypothetical protein QM582_12530 [Micropruina sp.]